MRRDSELHDGSHAVTHNHTLGVALSSRRIPARAAPDRDEGVWHRLQRTPVALGNGSNKLDIAAHAVRIGVHAQLSHRSIQEADIVVDPI